MAVVELPNPEELEEIHRKAFTRRVALVTAVFAVILAIASEEEETRYRDEKKEIETEAKKLEQERDLYRSKLPYFEYAEVLLQISIVMASVSILASSRFLFSVALSFAALGTALTVNGFFLIFRIPLMP